MAVQHQAWTRLRQLVTAASLHPMSSVSTRVLQSAACRSPHTLPPAPMGTACHVQQGTDSAACRLTCCAPCRQVPAVAAAPSRAVVHDVVVPLMATCPEAIDADGAGGRGLAGAAPVGTCGIKLEQDVLPLGDLSSGSSLLHLRP